MPFRWWQVNEQPRDVLTDRLTIYGPFQQFLADVSSKQRSGARMHP